MDSLLRSNAAECVAETSTDPVRLELEWWRGAVVYQIYIRSFQDSNGDGIGDIKGITARLPHVASLGVDAIWIAPFFRSPMKDFGYDIADYREIDPSFGTLSDFDELLAAARDLGIRVLVDLALSHTSDRHPWFTESRSSRDHARSDWYVWADPKPDGTPPNNWLSVFGGSSWAWDSTRQQYYLHNFLASQPDLNFHNPSVQDAVIDVAKFWLDRGVDGFRLDTINFYFHDLQLRDNPPLPDEFRNTSIAPSVNPYNYQCHRYDKNRPENIAFLGRLRSLLERYPESIAIGEVGDAQRGLEILAEYTSGDNRIHMCYAFEFLSGNRPNAGRFADVLAQLARLGPDAWPAWAFSNHDVERHATRWNLGPERNRVMIHLMVCLKGALCLYQGEELGLPQADLAFEDLRDPYGVRFWPEFPGRDGCRTPMVWKSTARNCGFSDVRPWLPVPEAHRVLAADRQAGDAGSVLSAYRSAIALRRASPALRTGSLEVLAAEGDFLALERRLGAERVVCAFNFGDDAVEFDFPHGEWTTLAGIRDAGDDGWALSGSIRLKGNDCIIAVLKEEP